MAGLIFYLTTKTFSISAIRLFCFLIICVYWSSTLHFLQELSVLHIGWGGEGGGRGDWEGEHM